MYSVTYIGLGESLLVAVHEAEINSEPSPPSKRSGAVKGSTC
jgi:hypothetical protein